MRDLCRLSLAVTCTHPFIPFTSVESWEPQLSSYLPKDTMLVRSACLMPTLRLLTFTRSRAEWQTNVLGPYLLTKLLVRKNFVAGHGRLMFPFQIPALRACFTRTGVKPRVINLSSALLTGAPKNLMGIDWKLLKGGIDRDTAIKSNKYDSMTLYGQSKLVSSRERNCERHPKPLLSRQTSLYP